VKRSRPCRASLAAYCSQGSAVCTGERRYLPVLEDRRLDFEGVVGTDELAVRRTTSFLARRSHGRAKRVALSPSRRQHARHQPFPDDAARARGDLTA
jgi:hypothetical protein